MQTSTDLRDGILTLTGIAVLLALLRMSSDIVVPFLLSLFISIIMATPVDLLKKRGLSTALSIVIVVLSVVVVLGLVSLMVGSTASQFNEALPVYQSRLNDLTGEASTWLAGRGIKIEEAGIFSAFDPSAVMDFANKLVLGIGDVLSNALLIMFTVMFMLIDAAGFSRKLAAMQGNAGESALHQIAKVVQGVNRYFGAKALVSMVTGLLIWIALELVGLDFAPLWGFIAFVLNFVPNIGSVLAAVPAVLLAMLQFEPTMVIVVIGIYLAVNVIIGNLIEPTIMGQRVGLSTLSVFLSLVFWGWMFGPVGMLLSVPLSMVVKFAAEANPQTQWFAVLLAPAPAASAGEDPAVK